MQPDLDTIRSNALWFARQYSLAEQNFTLLRLEDSQYREASFLDHFGG